MLPLFICECCTTGAIIRHLLLSSHSPLLLSLLVSSRLLRNVDNSAPNMCDGSVKQKDLKINYGQSVHLSCPLHTFDSDSQSNKLNNVKWILYRNERPSGVEITMRKDKFIFTSDHGLVILSTTDREAGRYECKLNNFPLIRYDVFVDPSKCCIIVPSFKSFPSSCLLILFSFLFFSFTVSFSVESCTATNELEFKKVYSDWCHEFEKYKSAMKSWQLKQSVS